MLPMNAIVKSANGRVQSLSTATEPMCFGDGLFGFDSPNSDLRKLPPSTYSNIGFLAFFEGGRVEDYLIAGPPVHRGIVVSEGGADDFMLQPKVASTALHRLTNSHAIGSTLAGPSIPLCFLRGVPRATSQGLGSHSLPEMSVAKT